MTPKNAAFIFAMISLVLGLAFFYSRWAGAEGSLTVAGVTVDESRAGALVSLYGGATNLDTGLYDSLHAADAAAYVVPADRVLWITGLTVYTHAATPTRVRLGYSTETFTNTSTAPTLGDEVYRVVLPAVADLHALSLAAAIPAGSTPWVHVDNDATWSIPATGFLARDTWPGAILD
tara:strand:- start:335 stop:865 length:531 start_codon:yes stop_codon:yes gene_type:complete